MRIPLEITYWLGEGEEIAFNVLDHNKYKECKNSEDWYILETKDLKPYKPEEWVLKCGNSKVGQTESIIFNNINKLGWFGALNSNLKDFDPEEFYLEGAL